MKCSYCGCQVNDDAQFCINCGAKLSMKQSIKQDNSNALIAIVVVVAVILLAGLGAAYYFLVMDREDSEYQPWKPFCFTDLHGVTCGRN